MYDSGNPDPTDAYFWEERWHRKQMEHDRLSTDSYSEFYYHLQKHFRGAAFMNELESRDDFALQVDHEVDLRVQTAKRFPRNVVGVLDTATALATVDEDTATSMHYCLVRFDKRQNQNVYIRGASVRFAELLAAVWGNLQVQARITDTTADRVVATGYCWDLQTNTAISIEHAVPIHRKDMIEMVAAAAIAKARRNAVLACIPKAIWEPVYKRSVECSIGKDTKSLAEMRTDAVKALAKIGVLESQILESLKVDSVDKISEEDIEVLRGFYSSIKNDGQKIEDVLGVAPPVPEAEQRKMKKIFGKCKTVDEVNEAEGALTAGIEGQQLLFTQKVADEARRLLLGS